MTKFDPNEPYYQGFREVLREIDHQVSTTDQDCRESPGPMNSGMRDAWLRAQKVVAADVERLQSKPEKR
jgi:hypothetical protein